MSEAEEYSLLFVRTWAEAVLRQVERVRSARRESTRNSRMYDRNDELTLTENDLQRDFRRLWAEEHTLLWAAYQLERWKHRLMTERGQEPARGDKVLANLRSALEHLNEAQFQEDEAVAGGRLENRALRRLPDGRLSITVGGDRMFSLIAQEDLEDRALTAVGEIETELERPAVEWYIETSMQGRWNESE